MAVLEGKASEGALRAHYATLRARLEETTGPLVGLVDARSIGLHSFSRSRRQLSARLVRDVEPHFHRMRAQVFLVNGAFGSGITRAFLALSPRPFPVQVSREPERALRWLHARLAFDIEGALQALDTGSDSQRVA